MESETTQRKRAKYLLPFNIQAEMSCLRLVRQGVEWRFAQQRLPRSLISVNWSFSCLTPMKGTYLLYPSCNSFNPI